VYVKLAVGEVHFAVIYQFTNIHGPKVNVVIPVNANIFTKLKALKLVKFKFAAVKSPKLVKDSRK